MVGIMNGFENQYAAVSSVQSRQHLETCCTDYLDSRDNRKMIFTFPYLKLNSSSKQLPTICSGLFSLVRLYSLFVFRLQKRRGDKKRKSLIWHGLKPRFSRWKKAWSDAGDSLEQNCDHRSSLVHETAEQYTSPQFSRSQPSSLRSLTREQLGSSDYAGNIREPLFVRSDIELRIGTLSKHGSLRRHGFTVAGKQRLLLTEVSFSFFILSVSLNIFLKFLQTLNFVKCFQWLLQCCFTFRIVFLNPTIFFFFFFFQIENQKFFRKISTVFEDLWIITAVVCEVQ